MAKDGHAVAGATGRDVDHPVFSFRSGNDDFVGPGDHLGGIYKAFCDSLNVVFCFGPIVHPLAVSGVEALAKNEEDAWLCYVVALLVRIDFLAARGRPPIAPATN